jgi:valyl-tRNA synthetase
MSTIDAHYTPAHHFARDADRYAAWERAGLFRPRRAAERFAMILPPLNITGGLHLGHAYEHAVSDAFIRHRRMQGAETLWLPGTDHAGIATQALMERQLAAEGTSRQELGRDAFLARTRAWRDATSETITSQMRRLGMSPDWGRSTYSLDPGPARATHAAFSRLFQQGLIYRAERDTLWCTGCQTGLSDIETTGTTETGGGICTRCSSRIEIRSTPQWYLATTTLAAPARLAFESGQLRIDPPELATEYLRWLDEMRDWCLSRQLWWGHRIPIWYGADGQARSFGPDEAIPAGWTQDEDTLDTWFSSGLWPLSTLGWPESTEDLARYYPNDLLITGSDLLFFWAIRMTMLCTHLTGTAPFKRLYLHGMIRTEHGKKMSTSFGNTIDPIDYADEFGTDALRLALCRRARPGTDLSFGRTDLTGALALLKKLWSIARLTTAHGIHLPAGTPPQPQEPAHPLDRWLASRLERTRALTTAGFEELDLAGTTDALARFMYDDLSDLYLEARKPSLRHDPGSRATLAATLAELLLLLHPIAPYLTEQLWEFLAGTGGARQDALDAQPWPTARPWRLDPKAETEADRLRRLLHAARSHRAKQGIPAGTMLPGHADGLECSAELLRLARLRPDDTIRDRHAAAIFTSGPATLTIGTARPL